MTKGWSAEAVFWHVRKVEGVRVTTRWKGLGKHQAKLERFTTDWEGTILTLSTQKITNCKKKTIDISKRQACFVFNAKEATRTRLAPSRLLFHQFPNKPPPGTKHCAPGSKRLWACAAGKFAAWYCGFEVGLDGVDASSSSSLNAPGSTYATFSEGDTTLREDIVVVDDEHVEELVSDFAAFAVDVDAHHVVPLPIPVTDSNEESGAMVEFFGSYMCTMMSVGV